MFDIGTRVGAHVIEEKWEHIIERERERERQTERERERERERGEALPSSPPYPRRLSRAREPLLQLLLSSPVLPRSAICWSAAARVDDVSSERSQITAAPRPAGKTNCFSVTVSWSVSAANYHVDFKVVSKQPLPRQP